MADDPNPAISEQLEAARGVLAPQIRGLADLANVSISTTLRDKIKMVENARKRRDDLILTALNARDGYIAALAALEADGYPDLPNIPIAGDLLAEIEGEFEDLMASVQLFQAEPATVLNVNLGDPVAKPEGA